MRVSVFGQDPDLAVFEPRFAPVDPPGLLLFPQSRPRLLRLQQLELM